MSRTELELILPSGFRFHPTDEELVSDYLCRKCTGRPISAPIIAEIDLYRYDPWQLPELAVYGEKEWYFFSPRDRKYPNGCRPNRAAGSGYWKATGVDKPVGKPKPLGIKKALVFYSGKAPKGIKTNWIMHEYRLANVDRSAGRNTSLRLDDWVLCRIYNKKGSAIPKEYTTDQKASTTNAHYYHNDKDRVDRKPTATNSLQTSQHHNTSAPLIRQANYSTRMAPTNFFRPPSTPTPPPPPPPSASVGVKNDMFNFDPSDSSIPRHQNTESSGSEHVLSTSELSNCDREVQSQRQMNGLDFGFNSMGCDPFDAAPYQVKFEHDMEGSLPLEDIFMYLR